MPEIIQRTLQDSPILLQWYSWGAIAGFIGALAIAAWIFIDAQRNGEEATLWKSLAAVASVVGIPAVLARAHAGFAFEMRDSLGLVAGFSMVGAMLAIVTLFGYAATRGRALTECPVCGQKQQPGWSQCPYHPVLQMSQPGAAPTQIAGVAPTDFSSKETRIATPGDFGGNGSASPVPHRGTVILSPQDEVAPLGLLVISGGQYANTTLPLKAGVTTLGRDGRANDHKIDDDAVSERHLSIRLQDGRFSATDLDSSNGTFVNSQRIEGKRVLEANDTVRIGKTSMVFIQVGPTGDAPAVRDAVGPSA
jgi:hypothetical protein